MDKSKVTQFLSLSFSCRPWSSEQTWALVMTVCSASGCQVGTTSTAWSSYSSSACCTSAVLITSALSAAMQWDCCCMGWAGTHCLGSLHSCSTRGWREELSHSTLPTGLWPCFPLLRVIASWLVEWGFCHQLVPQSWDLLGVLKREKRGRGEGRSIHNPLFMQNTHQPSLHRLFTHTLTCTYCSHIWPQDLDLNFFFSWSEFFKNFKGDLLYWISSPIL